jgi:putative NADH-flavin reductase
MGGDDYLSAFEKVLGAYGTQKAAGVQANTQREQIAANQAVAQTQAANQRLLILVGGAAVCVVALAVVLHR